MKVGSKQYFNNVIKELDNIKKYATKEELDKLDIYKLNSASKYDCIYGLLTGSCFSSRATELTKLCTNRLKTCFRSLSLIDLIKNKPRYQTCTGFSYLEHCIFKYGHNNYNIISYLKGEVSDITLTK
jgi:hypothetical protein